MHEGRFILALFILFSMEHFIVKFFIVLFGGLLLGILGYNLMLTVAAQQGQIFGSVANVQGISSGTSPNAFPSGAVGNGIPGSIIHPAYLPKAGQVSGDANSGQ